MILERRQSLWFRLVSWLVWNIPGRPAAKMAGFSHTEYGSGLDMLAAVAQTPSRELRAKYYQHALDELKHSQLFRERAQALSPVRSRAQAVLDDGDFIAEHGIRGKEPLFERMDETEFLAFVWVHERHGAAQFDVYSELMKDDDASAKMFEIIARDERFHISYSRHELDRLEKQGQRASVRKAVFTVRARRLYQGWLRFARVFGNVMAGLWLSLLYGLLIGPFSVIARLTEGSATGFQPPSERLVRPVEAALEQG